MLDPSAMQQARMNTNLPLYVGTGRDEKKALKRAKEAERAPSGPPRATSPILSGAG